MLQDIPSPDGRRHVVVFTRRCERTDGFSTEASVLTKGRTSQAGGNVFASDTDHNDAVAVADRGPRVAARWIDSRTIEIRYDIHARVLTRVDRHDDTDIRFIADVGPPPHS